MKKLVTIFNVNNPTPTAMSIRAHNPSEVHVLLVGHGSYKDSQKDSLNRFERWVSGSMRPADFPEHIWLPRLDWPSLSDCGTNVHFHRLSDVSDFDISLLDSSTTVEFVSGTKEMGVALMTHCQFSTATIGEVGFTVTQLTGSIVDIVSGQESEPHTNLSIRERVWLSAGKIAKTGPQGSALIGEEIKNWSYSETKSASGKRAKRTPENQTELASILDIRTKNERDFNLGWWLEKFASNVIATWPDVVETWTQLHVIAGTWKDFVGTTMSNPSLKYSIIGYNPKGVTEWPYGYDEAGEKNDVEPSQYIEWLSNDQMQFLESTTLDESQIEYLWSYAYQLDVDVVALLENGFYIFVECKHMKSINDDPPSRVLAISSSIAHASIPVVVYSGNKTKIDDNQGVVVISWPDLANPLIGIASTNRRKLTLFLSTDTPPTEVDNTVSNTQIADPKILQERQKLVDKIGKALVAFLDGTSCTWKLATGIMSENITTEQKKEIFGNSKFTISKARQYLSEYITIIGQGNDAIVEPVRPAQR